ncbi:hypothetical protein [Pediococcus sp. AC40]|uniref:hypothetical protein n=1 Tax=Pediococcus sp. AC40 TaxID=2962679 RepID=UPI00128BF131|nr:hypothetical protein [Pediococcus sp. AC40]
MDQKMSEKEKILIRQALDSGMTFDEIMDCLESSDEGDYAEISYSTDSGKAYLMGNGEAILKGIIALINQFINSAPVQTRGRIINELDTYMLNRSMEWVTRDKNSEHNCMNTVDEKDFPDELKEVFKDIFEDRFGGE